MGRLYLLKIIRNIPGVLPGLPTAFTLACLIPAWLETCCTATTIRPHRQDEGCDNEGSKEIRHEPRSLLGLIPNRAPFHGRVYKLLSQGDLVKQEKNEQDEA